MKYVYILEGHDLSIKFIYNLLERHNLSFRAIPGTWFNKPTNYYLSTNIENKEFNFDKSTFNSIDLYLKEDVFLHLDYYLIPWGIKGVCKSYLFVTNNETISHAINTQCNYILSNYESDCIKRIAWRKFALESHDNILSYCKNYNLVFNKWLFIYRKNEYGSINCILGELMETYEFEKHEKNLNLKKVKLNLFPNEKYVAVMPLDHFTFSCLMEHGSYISGNVLSIFDFIEKDGFDCNIDDSFQEQKQVKELFNLSKISEVNIINDMFYYDEGQCLLSINNKDLAIKFQNYMKKNSFDLLGVW